jgi:hypothetical protein
MLGFHRRTRSLIPVKDLGKYDKVPLEDEETDVESNVDEMESEIMADGPSKAHRRQLLLVYLVFIAEAYARPIHVILSGSKLMQGQDHGLESPISTSNADLRQ